MTDTAPTEDPNKVEEIKTQARSLIENIKAEFAQRLDQLLDEIGALI